MRSLSRQKGIHHALLILQWINDRALAQAALLFWGRTLALLPIPSRELLRIYALLVLAQLAQLNEVCKTDG